MRLARANIVLALGLAILAPSAPRAEEVEKKFRLSFGAGGATTNDEVRSASANILTMINDFGEVETRWVDPRSDDAYSGKLKVEGSPQVSLSAQYALSRIFLLEAAVGYHEAEVGSIEIHMLQLPFAGFRRIAAGDLTRIPLTLSGLVRFRPAARFNPYVGGGIGYTFLGFTPSAELDELSVNMNNSFGKLATLRPEKFGTGFNTPLPNVPMEQLSGAEVKARDYFEWHVAAGAELSFGPHWAAFFDSRLTMGSGQFEIGFNGGQELGVSVPQGSVSIHDPAATAWYGTYLILQGGLLDYDGDGDLETGAHYYVQGGTLSLDAVTFQIGVRYTF